MGGVVHLAAAAALLLAALLLPPAAALDTYSLVYKGCSSQPIPGGPPPTIGALSSALSAQSSAAKFYKTTSTSSSSSYPSVFGLFQCRGDLDQPSCAECVSHALSLWASLCGPSAAAARVQLLGCLALYQVANYPQNSGIQLLYKTCGTGGADGGFEVKRDTAFSQLEGGIGQGLGFFATSYQGVYAMAQCEGDLSSGDCGTCVNQAVQRSEVECGGAPSGQVYLDKCYMSYSYYPHGAPGNGGNGIIGIGGGGGGLGGGQQTTKTVAIVLGGAVALGFVVICLLFVRSVLKKKDDI